MYECSFCLYRGQFNWHSQHDYLSLQNFKHYGEVGFYRLHYRITYLSGARKLPGEWHNEFSES